MKHSQVTRRVLNAWGSVVLSVQGVFSSITAAAESSHVSALYKDVEHCFDSVHKLDIKAAALRDSAAGLIRVAEQVTARARITEGAATNAHKEALDARAELLAELEALS